jgi:hypothetical protein
MLEYRSVYRTARGNGCPTSRIKMAVASSFNMVIETGNGNKALNVFYPLPDLSWMPPIFFFIMRASEAQANRHRLGLAFVGKLRENTVKRG